MTGGQQILIISHEAKVPEWALLLAENLRTAGFSPEISSTNKEGKLYSVIISGSPEEYNGSAFIYFQSKTPTEYPFLSILSAYLLLNNNVTELAAAAHRRFRSRKEEELHAVFVLEKAVKLYLNGIPVPLKFTLPALSNRKQPGRLQRWFTKDIWKPAILAAPIQAIAIGKVNPQILFPFNDDGHLRADPFGVCRGGIEYLFYEKQSGDNPGNITLLHNGREHVLLKGHHLSYPYIFEADGQIWCIPEQHVTRKTDLYTFDTESCRLRHTATILKDFAATDPTVFFHNGTWWLFCTDTDHQGANSRLHLFYADHPAGDWQPHPLNPVVNSVCGGRPGGTPFIQEGELYRPGQNNSQTYGGSLLFFRITEISRTQYAEVPAGELGPWQIDSSYSGLHTISAYGNRTLVDLKKKVFSFRNLLRLLRKKRVQS